MSRRNGDLLSDEDRILWSQVARTAKPLRPVKHEPAKLARPATEPVNSAPAAKTSPPAPAYRPAPAAPAPRGHIDQQTIDKLAKGRLPLEARVDLHGMRQDEAYSLLLSFVSRAHGRGVRYVLVITGKGSASGGDGVLKRSVPAWLRTTPFQPYVSGLDQAARGHGGAGALYLRLKRQRAAS